MTFDLDGNLASDWLIALWKTLPLSVYIIIYLMTNASCTANTHTHTQSGHTACCPDRSRSDGCWDVLVQGVLMDAEHPHSVTSACFYLIILSFCPSQGPVSEISWHCHFNSMEADNGVALKATLVNRL